ncbi:MAG: hypothetical protein H7Y22_00920 [Gemmatimonadaceae bacterium]|nr:hypothetical protein [Gloeobacterales cyanobacterium ES-bin-141]
MPELRSLEQIELDNPGFGLSRRFEGEGVLYSIFYRDAQSVSRHVHCTSKEQIQPLIEKLKAQQECRP